MQHRTRPAGPFGPARLLIVDDHELARAGLRSMLSGERDLEVVDEAVNGHQALALCGRLRPDLVLMDVRMSDMDGLTATRAVKQRSPSTSVIVITMHENPDYLLEARKAGAAGFLLKGATKHELVTTIRRVLRGESVLRPELINPSLARLLNRPAQQACTTLQALTAREREVLQLIAQGKTNRAIASELVVSMSTVKAHVEHIITKLGVSDRTQAAVRAIEFGFLSSFTPSAAKAV